MFCGFCGEQLNKTDKFCLNCGEAKGTAKRIEEVKPVYVSDSASKVEDTKKDNAEEVSAKESLFGFLRSSRFWKVIGFATVIGLIFIPSAIYLTSKPNSENQVVVAVSPEPTSASPAPTQSKIEPSPDPKPTDTPTPKNSKSPKTKTEAMLCRTIIQFGEEKQCFKLSETTQLTVESKYGDCPILNASNGTCDVGSVVIVPTDRGSVIKPCSPGGDIKYSVGMAGGVIGGGEPSSLRNEKCLTKSNNTYGFILNYFPPLSSMKPNSISVTTYTLPEIGVEVIDEFIN
jgi:hypothetical protein